VFFVAFSVILAVKTLAARNNRRARRRRRAVSTMEVLFWAFSAILAVKTPFLGVLCDLGGKSPTPGKFPVYAGQNFAS